jgi:hypothetical protein
MARDSHQALWNATCSLVFQMPNGDGWRPRVAESFTFGIPLIARAAARDWNVVVALLGLTLASILAQTDAGFQIVIAGHDRPALPRDERLRFLPAEWVPEPVRSDNRDAGRKKFAIARHVVEHGGGLLMFVDADDWVPRGLVRAARETIGPNDLGGLIAHGFATDLHSLRTAPLPHPAIFAGGFHEVCGSSIVARLRPDDRDPLRRDPFAILHEHYRWAEQAQALGASVVQLDVAGNYVINTSQNHSETHGPYVDWRQGFVQAVRRHGMPASRAFLAEFGLTPDQVRKAAGGRGPGNPRRAPVLLLAKGERQW